MLIASNYNKLLKRLLEFVFKHQLLNSHTFHTQHWDNKNLTEKARFPSMIVGLNSSKTGRRRSTWSNLAPQRSKKMWQHAMQTSCSSSQQCLHHVCTHCELCDLLLGSTLKHSRLFESLTFSSIWPPQNTASCPYVREAVFSTGCSFSTGFKVSCTLNFVLHPTSAMVGCLLFGIVCGITTTLQSSFPVFYHC